MIPVRHSEVIAWWCPFPVTSMGGVIESMQVQQVTTVQIVLVCCKHYLFRSSSPAEAVITLEPYSGPLVKCCNRTRNLSLYQVCLTRRGIVSGSSVPSYCLEIISVGTRLFPASFRIASVNFPTAPVPFENRLKVTFLAQSYLNIHKVEACFWSYRVRHL